ncbi:AzlD domain-containing protein [Verticiella sediminum]|uniref:AzlD domain-containing protein n=1 Tax=Verticiella sediminum TaxID=1247510 RepID=A0A556AVN8_9BURK|nr:AzlD domain-containing protein [Verticiella sediminum]TSH97013.1 AzlD domain-containing protein [Verticiella sediminum]
MSADVGYVLLAILMLLLCSALARCGYLLLGDFFPLPESVRRAFRYAPVAALVGIIVPDVLSWHPGSLPEVDARLPAVIIAAWIMWRTRSALATIGTGMLVLLALRWLAG